MRPGEYFIDDDNKIRLEHVLLGIDDDEILGTITDDERKVKERR